MNRTIDEQDQTVYKGPTLKQLIISAWDVALSAQLESVDNLDDEGNPISKKAILKRTTVWNILESIGSINPDSFLILSRIKELQTEMQESGMLGVSTLMGLHRWCLVSLLDGEFEQRDFETEALALIKSAVGAYPNTIYATKSKSKANETSRQYMVVEALQSEAHESFFGKTVPPFDVVETCAGYLPWFKIAYLTSLWYVEIATAILSSIQTGDEKQ